MKKTVLSGKIKRAIASVLVLALAVQATYMGDAYVQAQETGEAVEADTAEDDYRVEEMSSRTAYSTTYDLGNGQHETEIYSSQVRYVDEETGRLRDYNPNVTEVSEEETNLGTSLEDYAYENEMGDKKHYFPESLDADTPIITEYKEYQLCMAPVISKDNEASVCAAEETQDLYGNVSEESNSVRYADISSGVDIRFDSLEQGIKESIILKQRPAVYAFYYSINMEGCHPELVCDNEHSRQVNLIDDESGEAVGCIPEPYMYDSSEDGNYSDECSYTLRKTGTGSYVLGIRVSKEYFEQDDIQYPVTIDPTVEWQSYAGYIDATYVVDGRMQEAN